MKSIRSVLFLALAICVLRATCDNQATEPAKEEPSTTPTSSPELTSETIPATTTEAAVSSSATTTETNEDTATQLPKEKQGGADTSNQTTNEEKLPDIEQTTSIAAESTTGASLSTTATQTELNTGTETTHDTVSTVPSDADTTTGVSTTSLSESTHSSSDSSAKPLTGPAPTTISLPVNSSTCLDVKFNLSLLVKYKNLKQDNLTEASFDVNFQNLNVTCDQATRQAELRIQTVENWNITLIWAGLEGTQNYALTHADVSYTIDQARFPEASPESLGSFHAKTPSPFKASETKIGSGFQFDSTRIHLQDNVTLVFANLSGQAHLKSSSSNKCKLRWYLGLIGTGLTAVVCFFVYKYIKRRSGFQRLAVQPPTSRVV